MFWCGYRAAERQYMIRQKSRQLGLILVLLCITVAGFPVPTYLNAAQNVAVSCSVAVEYVHDTVTVEQYQIDFVVEEGVVFEDDFSTPLREGLFTATVAKDANNAVVTIDYFNDVGTFHAIGFHTNLTIHASGKFESTSGSNGFFASSAVIPESVSGNHVTNYSLTCRRD